MSEQCQHLAFDASVAVNRIETTPSKVAAFSADISITCMECKLPFVFLGVGIVGLSYEQPTVNLDHTQLRQPIAPCADWTSGESLPGYTLTKVTRNQSLAADGEE